jgi:hypothetical protein
MAAYQWSCRWPAIRSYGRWSEEGVVSWPR